MKHHLVLVSTKSNVACSRHIVGYSSKSNMACSRHIVGYSTKSNVACSRHIVGYSSKSNKACSRHIVGYSAKSNMACSRHIVGYSSKSNMACSRHIVGYSVKSNMACSRHLVWIIKLLAEIGICWFLNYDNMTFQRAEIRIDLLTVTTSIYDSSHSRFCSKFLMLNKRRKELIVFSILDTQSSNEVCLY